jgi:hypothetical protein
MITRKNKNHHFNQCSYAKSMTRLEYVSLACLGCASAVGRSASISPWQDTICGNDIRIWI